MPPKSDKEVVFFLTNVGVQPRNGDKDFLDKAKEVMTLVVTKKIFMRPKDEVGIMLGARTEADSSTLFQQNQVPTWEIVEKISCLRQSDVQFDNWQKALANTIDHIEQSVRASRIVLIMLFDLDDTCPAPKSSRTRNIIQKTKDLQINLLWMGSKPLKDLPVEELNDSEKTLMEILKESMGEYGRIDKALPQLRLFKKTKGRYMAWKCPLQIGTIIIPSATYVQATDKVAKPSFKNVTIKSEQASATASQQQLTPSSETAPAAENDDETSNAREKPDNLQYVRYERDYVDRHKVAYSASDTILGYMYGRQFVPVPEADEVGMKYNGGPKSFEVFGFVPRESIKLEDFSGDDSRIVIPDEPLTAQPFYCLAQAMVDTNRVAIVRKVYAAGKDPKMCVLIPRLDVPGEPWCMILIELLYAEDRRVIQSRPLNSVMKHLSKEKENIVGDMIDAMMLTDCTDDEGHEIFSPGTVPSPNLQHHWDSLSFRALHPDDPLPPMSENLKKLIEPPESVQIKQKPLLSKLKELFPIEEELALLKKEAEASSQLAVPVLSEIKKMEDDLNQMASDVNEIENNVAEKGLKRKYSMDETDTLEESDPDLDDLFDADMSP